MANKIKSAFATAITPTITLDSLASSAVRISTQVDRGEGSIETDYRLEVVIDGFASPPVVGQRVSVHIATAHSVPADVDGTIGVTDAAGTDASLKNMIFVVSAIVQTTTQANRLIASAVVSIASQYFSVVVKNDTDDALAGLASHRITLIPIADEVQ